jgi:CRP-like cAMP-binding protein
MNPLPKTKDIEEVKSVKPSELTVESIISSHPFLRGMSANQLRLLSDSAILESFSTGEHIFHVGDPANRFYLIQEGRVALESFVEGKGNTAIQTIGAGDVLGWSWLFPPYFWHFSARALEVTRAVFIYATPLREECESDHDFGYEMMKRMAGVMIQRLQATRWKLLGSAPKLNPQS